MSEVDGMAERLSWHAIEWGERVGVEAPTQSKRLRKTMWDEDGGELMKMAREMGSELPATVRRVLIGSALLLVLWFMKRNTIDHLIAVT